MTHTFTTHHWPHAVGRYEPLRDDMRRPDQPDTLSELLKPRKLPGKPRARVDRRVYPRFFEGTSTRNYVAEYFRLNTARSTMRHKSACIHAYADHIDHLALYEPLSTAPQFTQLGIVDHEEIE